MGWRKCEDCEVSWDSTEKDCWSCGKPVSTKFGSRPALTSQVSPVSAMRDWDCEKLGLPL